MCLMASLRRVKVLLVLNLIAVAGFVLFLAKCRPIALRSGDGFHEIRPRAEVANLSAHSASPIQDAVLKRLSLLEDIVYRQLNGKDVRPCPQGSLNPGGLARGAGEPTPPGSRALPFTLSGPGGRGCWKELPVSLLLLWKHVCKAGSRSLCAGTCRNPYLETKSQVQKPVAWPNGTRGTD